MLILIFEQAGVSVFILDKLNLGSKNVKNREVHFIMIKDSIYQEDTEP